MSVPISACPACIVVPLAEGTAGKYSGNGADAVRIILSLPAIYCAACITGVERGLSAQPGVRSARVNLTLKRATIEADPEVTAQDLADYLISLGYEAYELDAASLSASETDKQGRDLMMRLGVAGFAMMNVMLLSVAIWSGAVGATRDMFHWISAAIAIPAIGFSAQIFFRSAWSALRVARLNMDVPISLAILLAAGMSVYEVSQSGEHAYFDAALSLTFFLLAGRFLDHRTRSVARSAAEELAALEVPRAVRVVAGLEALVPVHELNVGDIVRVVPGARMPVDGIVVSGESEVDRALLTGESLPAFAGPDTVVSAGEINLTGSLMVRVVAAGFDTNLHRMADLVAISENARNRYTSLADKAAQIYAPLVHLLALTAFLAWMWISGGDVRLSLNIAVAVLIITCPCALGLAVPAVTTAASGQLFKQGMLLKSATAMERLAEVTHVVFDKTGTLTQGVPLVENMEEAGEITRGLAATLARNSAHPLAVSLATALAEMADVEITEICEVPGFGIEGVWQGKRVRLGRANWAGVAQLDQTATYLSVADGPSQAFTFHDALRPGAASAVAGFQAQGLKVTLLSGDTPVAVESVAHELGIDDWQAEVLPEEKAAFVAGLCTDRTKVLMIGDGLNDTAALAAAHVSISPASALEATRVVSDIVLLGQTMAPLSGAYVLAKSATRRIKENFAIAALYNAVAIPIALAGFATPLAAALAMSASSISVSLNALRLRKAIK